MLRPLNWCGPPGSWRMLHVQLRAPFSLLVSASPSVPWLVYRCLLYLNLDEVGCAHRPNVGRYERRSKVVPGFTGEISLYNMTNQRYRLTGAWGSTGAMLGQGGGGVVAPQQDCQTQCNSDLQNCNAWSNPFAFIVCPFLYTLCSNNCGGGGGGGPPMCCPPGQVCGKCDPGATCVPRPGGGQMCTGQCWPRGAPCG
jgi:hypothetical protein